MNFWSYYADFLKFTLETALACFCFAGEIEKRSHFHLRCLSLFSAVIVLILPVSALALRAELGDYDAGTAAIYSFLSILAFFFVFACFRDSAWNLLFCCFSGAMIRMCAKKIFDIILSFVQLSGGNILLFAKGHAFRYVLYYPVLFTVYLIIYVCFRNIFRKGHLLTLDRKLFSIYIVIMGINLILNNLEPVLLNVAFKYYVLLVFCEMTYYILILCMQSFLFQMAQAKLEAHNLQELWRQDRQQYELMKKILKSSISCAMTCAISCTVQGNRRSSRRSLSRKWNIPSPFMTANFRPAARRSTSS